MADEPPETLQVQCDQAGNRIRISFYEDALDGDVKRSTLTPVNETDCSFANGTVVKVREGDNQTFAYGQCGGSPDPFFSLWVNRSKVLSHHAIWGCSGVYLRTVDVSPDGINDCTFKNGDDLDVYNTEMPRDHTFECKHLALPTEGSVIDAKEYSPNNADHAEVGSLILRGKENARFCDKFRAFDEMERTKDIQWTPEKGDENYVGTFDLDNDGVTEVVHWHEDYSHVADGSFYLVVPTGTDIPADWFAKMSQPASSEVGKFISDHPAAHMYSEGYTHWIIVRLEERFYLVGKPVNREANPAFIVAEAHDGSLKHICEFDRVRANF